MKWTPALKTFVEEHLGEDVDRLLLTASRYPEIDMPWAVDQIRARRQIREKLPDWYACGELVFPSRIAAEQCSSEQTALYKQRLIEDGCHLCDLTGGLGVDSYAFSRKAGTVTYTERFADYCEAARHNFKVLGAENIQVVNTEAEAWLDSSTGVDVFYLDPARRGEGNKRVFALSDCEPDLVGLLPSLFNRAPKVIAKISPMADLRQTMSLLPQTTEIHVVSVRNECKELLFVMEREHECEYPRIRCVNFRSDEREEVFDFDFRQESALSSLLAKEVAAYLYEPNVSVLKAGAFKSISSVFNLPKLEVSSHLYTSDDWVEAFPGRIFRVEEVLPFSGKLLKNLYSSIPKANITVRNFPLSVEELRKRTKIRDGGDVYLFGTTLQDGRKVLIRGGKL